MSAKDCVGLQAEFDRLQAVTGPVHICPCCPLCSKVIVKHLQTGIVVKSKSMRTPLASAVDALQELSRSLCN